MTSGEIGDNQGFVILDGPTHDAHLPAWARVMPALPAADVLVIDGDFSTLGPRYPQYGVFFNYRWYYTSALEQLGYSYHVLDYDTIDTLPDAAALSAYRAILYFTGDSYLGGAGLTNLDMDKLVEYLNAGGTVIVMGQDMAATIDHDETDPSNPHFFYQSALGANWIQDSLSGKVTPEALIRPTNGAPNFLAATGVDLTQAHQLGATGSLTGAQETPSVTTAARGTFTLFHELTDSYTEFNVTITPSATQPITITGLHIHAGATGVSGDVVRDLAALGGLPTPTIVTTTLRISGVISPSLTVNEVQQLRDKGLYINLHTTTNPNGELRGQIQPVVLDNQAYMDEIDNRYHNGSQSPNGDDNLTSIPLLYYQGPNNDYNGTVAMGHRLQPSLEKPGVTYAGRSVYATFGLEGLRNGVQAGAALTSTSRSELLDALLDWSWAPAPTTVQLTHTVALNGTIHQFSAQAAYGLQQRNTPPLSPKPVQYRWDFGDGRAYVTTAAAQISHQYLCGADNNHTVRVEITDTYGNAIIGSQVIAVSQNCATQIPVSYLPLVRK